MLFLSVNTTEVHANSFDTDDSSIKLQKPINAPVKRGFGLSYHPILRREQMNLGLVYSIPRRRVVVATADGVIDLVQDDKGRISLSLLHKHGFESRYENVTEAIVAPGTIVKQGDVIGYVSPSSGEEELFYYELQKRGNALDPTPFFQSVGQMM